MGQKTSVVAVRHAPCGARPLANLRLVPVKIPLVITAYHPRLRVPVTEHALPGNLILGQCKPWAVQALDSASLAGHTWCQVYAMR